MSFEQNIFINCPFDKAYKPILKAMVFGCVYLRYNPLLSEMKNSADSRISGIQDLISKAKYSIHDLSRMESTKKNQLARFNMPFELGIDVGCKRFGSEKMNEKCFLILDKDNYRYKRALSDISGNDIENHQNKPEVALRKIRNWIRKIKNDQIDSANKIWMLYNEFNGDQDQLISNGELTQDEIDDMPWSEYCYFVQQWLVGRKIID